MSTPPLESPTGDAPSAPAHRRNGIERRSIDYVPRSERHGKAWHLWPVWFCGDAHLTTLAVGVIGVSLGTNLLWASIAILAGCAFGTLFMAAHSAQGPHMGLPQLIQSRPQFGYVGALLVFVVAIATYIGYNAFNQILAGQTFHDILGFDADRSALGFTFLAMVMAFLGYSWFHKLQRYLSFILIAAMLIFTTNVLLFDSFPDGQFSFDGFSATAFLAQFFTAAAYQLSWAIYVSDYSRYLPAKVDTRATFWWTYLGATIGGSWMMLIGAAVAAMYPELNVAQALVETGNHVFDGFGEILTVLAVIGLITSAAQNFYGSSLTILSAVDSVRPIKATLLKRLVALLVAGAVAIFIAKNANDDFMTEFGSFLAIMLYLFTPWTAVNLVDYYFVRKGHYSIREIFNPRGMYGRWDWRGISAYALGFAAMIPFFVTVWWSGPIAETLGGADIAMLPGLVVASVFYYLVCRNLDLDGERALIARLDAGIDDDGVDATTTTPDSAVNAPLDTGPADPTDALPTR
ncbi:purine-cytosine permease family protein [Rhodococcus sp. JS3073]|uniref:purine-cytosine permease family protein n=1 Tax=Rhodococcus sp. JS3073 TaxID=3002901 RepID=UPI002285F7D5|nr:cytosine permease [Rhodococcus sp. JS3073]WAM19647.1 cytosine permease [Rhodococcus sp. JS3073]